MNKSRVLSFLCLAAGTALLWAGCRCEITIGKKNSGSGGTLVTGKGHLPHEHLLDQARKAAKDGDAPTAVRLALQGLTDWTKRAGYESARAKRYAKLLDRVIGEGGLETYLEFCAQPSTRAGAIACARSAATHLHAVAGDGKPAPSGIALYQGICLSGKTTAMSQACGAVPSSLAGDPSVLPKLRRMLSDSCMVRPMDGDLAQMCESAALAAWMVAMQRWDVPLLGEAGRALMAQDRATGIAMGLRLLSQAGPVPQEAVAVVEKLLLRALGSADGLSDLQIAFWQRFGPAQRKAVAAWAVKRLAGKEEQVAAVLDVLDARDSKKLLAKFGRMSALRPLVQKVIPFLGRSMARGEVEEYLRTGKGGRMGRAQALEYLRSHPSYFESRVLGQVANLPKKARKRLIDLIAEIRPEARFGSVSGMVVRHGLKPRQCRVFLDRLGECEYVSGGKVPARTIGLGIRLVRVKKGVPQGMTTQNGGIFLRHVPIGPYRVWVWCEDMSHAKALWEMEYDRKQGRIVSARCPVVVQPETETKMRAIQVDWTPADEGKGPGPVARLVAPVPKGAYRPAKGRRRRR